MNVFIDNNGTGVIDISDLSKALKNLKNKIRYLQLCNLQRITSANAHGLYIKEIFAFKFGIKKHTYPLKNRSSNLILNKTNQKASLTLLSSESFTRNVLFLCWDLILKF